MFTSIHLLSVLLEYLLYDCCILEHFGICSVQPLFFYILIAYSTVLNICIDLIITISSSVCMF